MPTGQDTWPHCLVVKDSFCFAVGELMKMMKKFIKLCSSTTMRVKVC